MSIIMTPIGQIHSPYKEPVGIPIQGALRHDVEADVEIYEEYQEGLKDVEGFSHLILLYCFHLSDGYTLVARPFLDDTPRGVFSIRSPRRPNPIGMTVVRLVKRDQNMLRIRGVDMVDGTPLLDIKPYIPDIDAHHPEKMGWIGEKMRERGQDRRADGRFHEESMIRDSD